MTALVGFQFRYMPDPRWGHQVHKDVRGLRANWSKAFTKLRYELARIKATDVVLEAGYKPTQLRNDGWPMATASPEHSAVRVWFKAKRQSLCFQYDGWRDVEMNVYMIALTLERLRAVERYGCTQSDEQYRGWSQLPPGTGKGPIVADEFGSANGARLFLAETAGVPLHRDVIDADLYRAAARRAHPDQGGTNELMAKVNRAKEYIENRPG